MTPYEKYITYPESLNRTVQDWSGKNYSVDRWANGLVETVGLAVAPSFDTVAEARMFFLYSLEPLFRGETDEPAVVWATISSKVEKMGKKMPWSLRDDEENGESKLSAPKVQKAKKKTGLDCATEWWLDNLKDLPGMTPKAIQDRMAKDCDLHRNSCRGIYYRLKKEMPISA
jgi:hypothetical protein